MEKARSVLVLADGLNRAGVALLLGECRLAVQAF